MKILYISRNKSDYLQDLVYTGLVKVLGVSNVIDFPWNNKFHFNFREYPRNIGLVKGSFMDSILSRYRSREYSLVIVASCHPESFRTYLGLIEKIDKSVKTIFIDGGDWSEVAGDLDRIGGRELYDEIQSVRPFDFIFKREYLLDKTYENNVFPLPFAFNLSRLPVIKYEYLYDVAFWAVESDPIRTKALTLLQDKFDCASNGTIRNQVMSRYKRKGDYYLQELACCRISLNFRGAGWDTLRYWEVPAVGGFMISQKPGIRIDNDFVENKDIIHCKDDLSDLVELCEYYLHHEDKRESIAKNALYRMKNYHTDIHRAKYILDISS